MSPAVQVFGPLPTIRGQVAYVPQTPFIIHGTFRENVLFGLPYDAARYEHCIHATCLEADLRALPGGDATELGDNGVNLSGGETGWLTLHSILTTLDR